jgi:hypothetical protein
MRHQGVRPLRALALLPALFTPCLLAPRAAMAQPPSEAAAGIRAAISSLDGDAATISAGADAGLGVGQELVVRRAGREVGRIVLSDVRTNTAIGRVTAADGETVQVLDTVVLPAASANAPAEPPAPAPPAPAPDLTTAEPQAPPSYNEHPSDIIPWERWEYMALSSLAADGLIPGYSARDFQASRQFTRGELADLTAKAMINYRAGAGQDRDSVFLNRLEHAFRYQPAVRDTLVQLAQMDATRPAATEKPTLPQVPGLSLYGGIRYAGFHGDDKVTVSGRVGGIYDVSDKAFLALSVNNLHDRTSAQPDAFSALDVATLNFSAWDADWEIGKTYLSSGPLQSGDGLLSDNAPGLYMAKMRRAFSWGKFPGKFTLTQVYGGFRDEGRTKYYGLRRIESRLGKRVQLGLAEAYVSTKAPGPLSLVLPFYAYQRIGVFGQHLGGHAAGSNDNDTFNYMAQLDLVARINRNLNLYGEYVVDDITAPFGLGQGDVPRKVAFVVGAHFPLLFGSRGSGRFEIYNGDRETYLGIAPQVAWTRKGLLLGSPFGPNTQAFYGRLDYRFTNQWKGILEMHDAVQFHNGAPNVGDRFALGATAAYDITPSQSVSLRLIGERYRGEGYTIRGTGVEIIGSYAY